MTRTTPPRPMDVQALFPELADRRGTTTRLHPRPGTPDVRASNVGGPLLWPVDEAWPVCTEPHPRGKGRRPADIHREREILAVAWARDRPTDDERMLLEQARGTHHAMDVSDDDALPMIAVAQLYHRDVADLPTGPDGCDLLQVFWCPFDLHGPTGHGMALDLRWRSSQDVGDVLTTPPRPPVVGFAGYVPEPCVLHPEQVATYPFAGVLPEALRAAIDAREETLDEQEEQAPRYQYDLSIPPGWRVGGFASWHTTDPAPMDCATCATPMNLLLTIDSSEWDGGSGSWKPLEDQSPIPSPYRLATPTEVVVGRWGELNIFACPADPRHLHRWSVQ